MERMTSATGCACATLLAAVATLLSLAPAAGAAGFEVTKWEAGTCTNVECEDSDVNEGKTSYFYTQAAGHPDFGITDFRFATKESGLLKAQVPIDHVKDVRVDLPPGLAVNPEATPTCEEAVLNSNEEACPPDSQVGVDEATGTATVLAKITIKEDFPVYNITRRPGEPSRFGVEVNSAKLRLAGLPPTDIYLQGGISWQEEPSTSENSGVPSGDYHEYFKIQNVGTEPELVESKLIFWGIPQEHQKPASEPPKAFITLPSTCSSRQITYLHVDSHEEPTRWLAYANETPITATGCDSLAFDPSLSLVPEASAPDAPDGVTATLHVPQSTDEPSKTNSPDVQSAQVTLPEGMTLNPSAANGLKACAEGEYASYSCPEASEIGSFSVNAPGIPPGSLSGGVYVGAPKPGEGPESGGMYRLFLLGETPQPDPQHFIPGGVYGVGLRLEGRVSANEKTGRLTATFANAPQVPFEDLTMHFKGGPRAPLANPLECGAVAPSAALLPYGGEPAREASASGFSVAGCASSPAPFSLTQSLAPQNAQAGAFSAFTFGLARADGQQYVSKITTTLPAGLLGLIPSVSLCAEAQANAGTCPASSQIGTVTVAAGAGGEPYEFPGSAYLTGPYGGSPYGLSVVVPAVAGPYDLGDVVTRAGVNVGLYSGRVIVTSVLPTIVGGVPLRLKSLSVDIDRPDFAVNPTSCSPLSTETLLGSTGGAGDSLSSPFQASGCGSLAFKPKLGVRTSAHPTKLGGASIEVTLTQGAHQANIRELQMQLPKQLVARFSTLQKACLAATFETGPPPGECAPSAKVGTVSVTTPVLPGRLTGTAWFVSHGAEAFPDLDLVVEGDGVEVVLVGHTHIAHSSVTTSTFEDLPDVPISSVIVKLPVGANSALASNGRLCGVRLLAPTTLIAQDGAKIAATAKLAVRGCPRRHASRRRRRHASHRRRHGSRRHRGRRG
jgi:hypothetical protein